MPDQNDRVKTFSFPELYKHPRLPENSIISHGLYKRGCMLVIGGAPKAYKSFLLLSIAVSLAIGRNLFGATRSNHGRHQAVFTIDRPRRILLFEQEIGEDDLEDRLAPMYETMSPSEQELFRQNFFSHSLDGDLNFDTKEGMKAIESIIMEVKPEIVMFDPLIEFHSQDENSPTSMANMLKNLTQLCRRTKTSPMFTHHESKGNAESTRSGGDRLRGASSLFGKADTVINVSVINRNAMRLRLEFTLRRGKPLVDLAVKLDSDTLEAKFLCWQGDKGWKNAVKQSLDEMGIGDLEGSEKIQ